MRYKLNDFEWSIIRPVLPAESRSVPRVDDRRVLNGIFWVLRSGATWRDLPDCYGPYTTCYNRFNRWRRAGIWDSILAAMRDRRDDGVQILDTSIVRVHQHASCVKECESNCTGRSRDGLTTKTHAVVDANGLPHRLALSAGQEHDCQLADDLLTELRYNGMLLADGAYDSDAIRELARERGAWANIPPKRNRRNPICFSPHLYRDRNQVERFFNRIKHCRRIATRYDKLAANFLAFIKLAAIRLWLGVYESTS
jgi:transposase